MTRTPPLEQGWKRWLVPSFFDLLSLSLLVWLFAVGKDGWMRLLLDGDAGWHIRTGDYIRLHGRVPTTDLFSFSRPGETWFAWEWLTDVIWSLLHGWGGMKALVLVAGTLFALFGAVLMHSIVRRGANFFIALALTLLGVGASTIHLLARPHLWTMLFFAVSMGLITADLRRPSRAIWALVPLTAIWTNLHGGFAGLIATLGLVTAGLAGEVWLRRRDWTEVRRYAYLTAACLAASALNPYGLRLHLHMFSYLSSDWIREVVAEFQSPSFRSENLLQFEILLLAALAAVGWFLSKKSLIEPILVLFWAHSTLGSVRHVPLFVAVALPMLAELAAEGWRKWTEGARKSSITGILASIANDAQPGLRRITPWAVIPLIVLAFLDKPLNWPRNFPVERFPVAMAEQQSALLTSSRVFTSDQWADYLIYRFYPRQKVFFDGRSDFYGEALGNEYVALFNARYNWRNLLEKHKIDVVLLEPKSPLATVLKEARDWRCVADDGAAVVFARRSE